MLPADEEIDAWAERLHDRCVDASPWFWLVVLAIAIWFAI